MAIDGPEPTEGYPESATTGIVYSGLAVEDVRLSDLFQAGQRLGYFRPLVAIGTGSSPLDWQFRVSHNSNASGFIGYQTSVFAWSSSFIDVFVHNQVIDNKLRLSFIHQIKTGGDIGCTWMGCGLWLRRSVWAGLSFASSGAVYNLTLPIKPTASSATVLASGAITAAHFYSPTSEYRSLLIQPVSGFSSAYLIDAGTTLDDPVGDTEEDGYVLYLGKNASLITNPGSSIVIDLYLPGGETLASGMSVSSSRTDPVSGGPFTTITWDNDIDSQSARDFSVTTPHRAGDLGRVTKNGPDLYYGGKRIYFWGYNIAFTATTGCTTGQMNSAVDRFLKMGMGLKQYTDPNTGEEYWSAGIIRFHHFDANTALNDGGQHTINMTRLQNMLYFINRLAEYGIFSTIDLHSMYGKAHPETNATKANSLLSGATTISAYHALVYFGLGNARADAVTYITTLCSTISAYSGMSMAQDPAIAYIHYFNEEVPPHDTTTPNNDAQGSAAEKAAINALFQAIDGQNFDWDRPAHASYCVTAATGYLAWADALMATLGYTGLTASLSNFQQGIPELEAVRLGLNRSNHIEPRHRYWNIPYFTSPYTAHQKPPSMRLPADDPVSFFYDFGDRPDGTCPMVLDEWNCVWPWRGAGEEDIVVSAVAATRGWGGIIKFDYAASVSYLTSTNSPAEYSITGDPLRCITCVAMRNLYGRRDIDPNVNQTEVNDSDGWVGTRQFAVNVWANQLRINTARSKAFSGNCGTTQTLDHVKIDMLIGNRQTVYVTSKDFQPIEHAETLVVLHITDTITAGTIWGSPRKLTHTTRGTTPIRLQHGLARLTLTVAALTKATIYPLDATGTRGTPITAQISDSKIVFELDNRTIPTIGYEIDLERLYGVPIAPFSM